MKIYLSGVCREEVFSRVVQVVESMTGTEVVWVTYLRCAETECGEADTILARLFGVAGDLPATTGRCAEDEYILKLGNGSRYRVRSFWQDGEAEVTLWSDDRTIPELAQR